jgi:hypothetical protein
MKKPSKSDRHLGQAIFTRVPPRIYKALKEESQNKRRFMGKQLLVILEERYPDVRQS